MVVEQQKSSLAELVLPELVFETEKEIWPHEPGVIFETQSHQPLKKLLNALDRHFTEETTLKNLALSLEVGGVVLAPLRRPRRGYTWFGGRNGRPLVEIADWIPVAERKLILAHELSHIAFGPDLETSDFALSQGLKHEIPPEIRQRYRLIERVCNWGAGYTLSRVKETGYTSL